MVEEIRRRLEGNYLKQQPWVEEAQEEGGSSSSGPWRSAGAEDTAERISTVEPPETAEPREPPEIPEHLHTRAIACRLDRVGDGLSGGACIHAVFRSRP